jgi:hypothetical protein
MDKSQTLAWLYIITEITQMIGVFLHYSFIFIPQ